MKKVLLFSLAIFFSLALNVPQIKISGVVSDGSGAGLPGVNVVEKGTTNGTVTDQHGYYELVVNDEKSIVIFSFIGFANEERKVGKERVIDISLTSDQTQLSEIVVSGMGITRKKEDLGYAVKSMAAEDHEFDSYYSPIVVEPNQNWNTEDYSTIHENIFLSPGKNPLSTFSIDVDAASYSNIRRFINNGQNPPKDAVRIEEMVNYFNYEYDGPVGDDPFAIHTEIASSPWSGDHKLLKIGLQGKEIAKENLPASNLVFLIDMSGSMSSANKLPLLKSSFKMLTKELRPQDRIAIVVYAGAAGLVLPSTDGTEKDKILRALDRLQAGGSTAGGAGINLAYEVAKNNFIEGGNNRVILATDGDFNIGESSNASMERLIEKKREAGVFLTVLGFGMGNYKDSKMEILADKGNGNYAYIDTIMEAKKVLISEFGGTLFTIAKDVKIQVEFNPAYVQAYRLIGYENRALKNEDFNNDKKDAGELGSGHTVTALYEIIPVGLKSEFLQSIDDLKYQKTPKNIGDKYSNELATVKLRYKQPQGSVSQLLVREVEDSGRDWESASENFRWAASVASLGMILRDSEFKGEATCDDVIGWAHAAKGSDHEGYRLEFINLAKSCSLLSASSE